MMFLSSFPEVPAERSPRRRSISGTSTSEKPTSMDTANTSPFKVPVSISHLYKNILLFYIFLELETITKESNTFSSRITLQYLG